MWEVGLTPSLSYFLAAHSGKSTTPACLWAGGRRKPRNAPLGTSTCSDWAFDMLGKYSNFWPVEMVFVRLGRGSRLKTWHRGRHIISWAATPPGCDYLNKVCGHGRGYCPGGLWFKFAFCRLDRGGRRGDQKERQVAPCLLSRTAIMPRHVGSTPKLDSDSPSAKGTCVHFRR